MTTRKKKALENQSFIKNVEYRPSRGSKMQSLLARQVNEEEEEDEFWKENKYFGKLTDLLNEEGVDDEYSKESSLADEFDSDFDNAPDSDDEEEEEKQVVEKKKPEAVSLRTRDKTAVVTPSKTGAATPVKSTPSKAAAKASSTKMALAKKLAKSRASKQFIEKDEKEAKKKNEVLKKILNKPKKKKAKKKAKKKKLPVKPTKASTKQAEQVQETVFVEEMETRKRSMQDKINAVFQKKKKVKKETPAQEPPKPKKGRYIHDFYTQEELMKEAALTEMINTKSLESLIKLENDKKVYHTWKKKAIEGPRVILKTRKGEANTFIDEMCFPDKNSYDAYFMIFQNRTKQEALPPVQYRIIQKQPVQLVQELSDKPPKSEMIVAEDEKMVEEKQEDAESEKKEEIEEEIEEEKEEIEEEKEEEEDEKEEKMDEIVIEKVQIEGEKPAEEEENGEPKVELELKDEAIIIEVEVVHPTAPAQSQKDSENIVRVKKKIQELEEEEKKKREQISFMKDLIRRKKGELENALKH